MNTSTTTLHHDKKQSTYYSSQARNAVAQRLLWCGGGRYRLESSTVKEWNLNPHIMAKRTVIQGHNDFCRKEWLLPCFVPLTCFKKGTYGHWPSEGMHGLWSWGGKYHIPANPREPPQTLRVTYWLFQGKCKWCDSNMPALAYFLVQTRFHLVTAKSPPMLRREYGHLPWGLCSSPGSCILEMNLLFWQF